MSDKIMMTLRLYIVQKMYHEFFLRSEITSYKLTLILCTGKRFLGPLRKKNFCLYLYINYDIQFR